MTTAVTTRCLARADLLLTVAQWLEPPGEVRLDWPDDDTTRLVAAAELDDGTALAHALTALHEATIGTPIVVRRDEHHRLFEGAARCATQEASYVRRDKGAILGDVCGFYRAFGFQPAGHGDRPDHLACELQFIALLLVMAARAEQAGRAHDHGVTVAALRSFFGEHLEPWLPHFAASLRQATMLPLYARFADVLDALVDAFAIAYGLPRTSNAADAPEPEPESPYECGLADGHAAVDVRIDGRSASRSRV